MKKSHEYDSPVLSKLVSVVTVLAICICSVCCVVTAAKVSSLTAGVVVSGDAQQSGGQQSGGQQSGGQQSGGQSNTPAGDSNAPAGDSNTPAGDSNTPAGDSNAPAGDSNTASGPSKEEILNKYTEVMNQLKSGVATYDKKEFQTLADDYDLGTVGNLVLPIAQNLMTGPDEAELQNRNDKEQIPIIRNEKGCLLTDASAIKSATMTESGGKTTIVIVLNDEKGAYPAEDGAASCGSIVGSMFNPLDQEEIDNIVAEFSGVVTMKKFELTCKDCTATLVFDTATGKVESLNQIMNYYIDVDATAVVVPVSGYATLTNDMTINNVTYK